MRGFVLPVIFILCAVGLFIGYINPAYQQVKTLRVQDGQYNDVLTQSTNLRTERDKLLAKRNTFQSSDVQKLERLLPDNVDNIRLIIDINDIAARYNLSLRDVQLSGDAQSSNTVGQSGGALGSVELSFTVSATYDSFITFLQDLEKSLRLVDVTGVSFTVGSSASNTAGTSNLTDYKVTIRTYWLR